jgi:hypothetical protein
MGKPTISMTIFNSYFDITRGYQYWISLETEDNMASVKNMALPGKKGRRWAEKLRRSRMQTLKFGKDIINYS